MNDRADWTSKSASDAKAHSHAARAGLIYALAAYLWWGAIPLYFKLVDEVDPLEVLAHRIVWSVAFLAGLLAVQRKWGMVRSALRSRRVMLVLLGTTLLIAFNWYLFVWSVANEHVLEASLGYFINPLVSVLLGMVFLRERLRAWQFTALMIATLGVVNLGVMNGVTPWISLALAGSFGSYGLLRKIVSVGPLVGLFIETTLLLPFAGWLVSSAALRDLPSGGGEMWILYAILLAAGVVTSLPLLWFTQATRLLRLSTIGFLQYLAPTCQFLLAVFLFRETFTAAHAITFGCIWTAVAIYSIDSLRTYREAQRLAVQESMNMVQE